MYGTSVRAINENYEYKFIQICYISKLNVHYKMIAVKCNIHKNVITEFIF